MNALWQIRLRAENSLNCFVVFEELNHAEIGSKKSSAAGEELKRRMYICTIFSAGEFPPVFHNSVCFMTVVVGWELTNHILHQVKPI